jgi:hypothetical protein
MRSIAYLSALTALGASLAVYACATTDSFNPNATDGSLGGYPTTTTTSTTSTSSDGSGGITSTTPTNKGGSNSTVINTSGSVNPDASCGSGDQPAQITPVYIVFLYDKSGSMGDDPNGQWQNLATRWEPMKLGMEDFFQNAGTIGIQASLEYFPAPGDKATTCHADYKTPAVPMTSLETPKPLIDSLDRQTPGGGTPTLPAVIGGINYAKQLMTTNEGAKAVVVLVTDGEPAIYNATTGEIETDCAPVGSTLTNTIPDIMNVVSAAYRGTPSIPTYVIGVGTPEAMDSMASIATSGGTDFILLDPTKPPEETRATLTKELQSIRSTYFQCSMPIPKSAEFDKNFVNVSFKHTDGTVQQLGLSAACTAPMGWYFDNPTTPTKIMLCDDTCKAIQKDLTGKLQILLGCKTIIL